LFQLWAMASRIRVCQGSSCRRQGSRGVLEEIEDLAAAFQKCTVQESGCLGLCHQAPAAIVVKQRKETPFTRVHSVDTSAQVVEFATGHAAVTLLQGTSQEQRGRLEDARAQHARDAAGSVSKWNSALKGLPELAVKKERFYRIELEVEGATLLAKAGFLERSLQSFYWLQASVGQLSGQVDFQDLFQLSIEIVLEKAKVLGKLGRTAEIEAIKQQVEVTWRTKVNPRMLKQIAEEINDAIKDSSSAVNISDAQSAPFGVPVIENYCLWSLETIRVVSAHCAVFHFATKDKKRGTPHPRGGGKPASPNTWYSTLLAPRGDNAGDVEGPLPWIERDYTPISSAKEWEQGKCDILIKIYQDGKATSWLHSLIAKAASLEVQAAESNAQEESKPLDMQKLRESGNMVTVPKDVPARLWLSKPNKTLSIPGLVPEGEPFRPDSLLLVLAGTGIVALPQVLAHRDGYGKLGISTFPSQQIRIPIEVIFCCRRDDILMLPEITQWCKESAHDHEPKRGAPPFRGVRHCTLALTEPEGKASEAPFPFEDSTFKDESASGLQSFEALHNTHLVHGRISLEMIKQNVSRMEAKCRIVVSGPVGFNTSVREMLLRCDVVDDQMTILTA